MSVTPIETVSSLHTGATSCKKRNLSCFRLPLYFKNLIFGPLSDLTPPKTPKQEFCQRIFSAAVTSRKNQKNSMHRFAIKTTELA